MKFKVGDRVTVHPDFNSRYAGEVGEIEVMDGSKFCECGVRWPDGGLYFYAGEHLVLEKGPAPEAEGPEPDPYAYDKWFLTCNCPDLIKGHHHGCQHEAYRKRQRSAS